MREGREVIKIGDTSFNLMTTSIDATTWRLMYHHGIREPNYPVPAHHYTTLIAGRGVEMCTGIKKEYCTDQYGEAYINWDCDCVLAIVPDAWLNWEEE